MAKRFIDTEIFRKQFIRGLPAPYKLLWIYIINECDNAGIWYVDEEIAQVILGKDAKFTLKKAIELFNKDEHRIVVFDNGKKWFILPFIDFQYGALRETNPAHRSVLEKLKSLENEGYIEFDEGAIKVLERTFHAPMDKDMDMEKDKDIDKEIDKEKETIEEKKKVPIKYSDAVTLTEDEHDKLCSELGEEGASWCIEKLTNYKLATGRKYKSDYRAILTWVINEYRKENRLNHTEQSVGEREKAKRDKEFFDYIQTKLDGT